MEADSDKDYYSLLGVSRRATSTQIKQAYKELARVYHPDSNFYDEIISEAVSPAQTTKFKSITAAYHTLSNEEKRKHYDESLPMGLRDWDEPKGDRDKDALRQKGGDSRSKAYAMGTFGSGAIRRKNMGDPLVMGANVRPVSEMIKMRRSLFGRLMSLLGL